MRAAFYLLALPYIWILNEGCTLLSYIIIYMLHSTFLRYHTYAALYATIHIHIEPEFYVIHMMDTFFIFSPISHNNHYLSEKAMVHRYKTRLS